MHGWMPVQFFEVCEGTEVFLKINRKRNSGSDSYHGLLPLR